MFVRVVSTLAGLGELYIDATSFLIEVNIAIGLGVDGVILAHVDVVTRVPLGATLADDDVACDDDLTAEFLDAETFAA